MPNVHARLKLLEASIAATSAEAALPRVGKPEVYNPPVSEFSETTSALLKTLPERLHFNESNLEMLGNVYRHWDRIETHKLASVESLPSQTTQKPCTICSSIASATTVCDGWHRTFVWNE